MRAGGRAIAGVAAIVVAGACATSAATAQLQRPPARAPCSALKGRPCHPSFCSAFHRGPCFPDYGAPIAVRFVDNRTIGSGKKATP
jgi:hypothetical protein